MNLIDLHTHGLTGLDSRSRKPEDYLKLALSMKAHGTDAFLPTLFPGPVDEMRGQMGAIKLAMELQGGSSPSSQAATILGAHLEGPFVNPAKAGALMPGAFLPATIDNLDRLVDGFEGVVRIITIAPEIPGALKIIEKAATMGMLVNMGHSAASFMEARDGARAGATGVTHLFNAMSGLHHREPGLAAYALLDEDLYVELIADMAHVHPEMLRLAIKLKRPDRVILVSDSLGAAKSGERSGGGPLYMPDGKTLAGSGITLAEAVENVKGLGVPASVAASFAAANPAARLRG